MKRILIALALALPCMAPADAGDPIPGKVAFFGLHFIDSSTEGAINGIRDDQVQRVAMARDYVAARFADAGYVMLDLAPVQGRIDQIANPAHCNGCEIRMGQELGADYTLVGEVQKVSNLIISMNLVLRDARTGAAIRAAAVDIRGNTDRSWKRGFSYLLRNRIFHDTTGGKK